MIMKKKIFARVLKDFLLENNLTQNEFALKAGLKQSQVSEWLKGKATPNYHTLRKIILTFGISSDWLGLQIKDD